MAPRMMKAAVCKETGQPLVIETLPIPNPTGRNLLVKVRATSLCHSDLTIWAGGLGRPLSNQILGHEAVCVVEELGPDAGTYGIKPGDTIGAPLWQDMCLSCFECRELGMQFCLKKQMMGMTVPGYFAEYALVDAAAAVVIPQEVLESRSPAELSPIFCAGITVWDALTRARLVPGESVAVVGVGGLGEMATKYASALGAKVIALDVRGEQLSAVKEGGSVDEVLNIAESPVKEDVALAVRGVNSGRGVDVVVVTSGSVKAYQTGLTLLRPEGRLIAVGIPSEEEMAFRMGMVAMMPISIIGAKVPGQIGTARCLEFCQRKGIFPKINPRKFQLEDLNEMMELMKAGKVEDGRMVIQFF